MRILCCIHRNCYVYLPQINNNDDDDDDDDDDNNNNNNNDLIGLHNYWLNQKFSLWSLKTSIQIAKIRRKSTIKNCKLIKNFCS